MICLAKKWLFKLAGPVFFCGLLLGLLPGGALAAEAFDDEGESQIYAHYVAGQQGAENAGGQNGADENNSTSAGEVSETVPSYAQGGEENNSNNSNNNNNENNNSENNSLENNNSENNAENNNSQNNNQSGNSSGQPVDEIDSAETDFPTLEDSMEVLLWDEAAQAHKKTRVTPVNLALRGAYLPSDVPALALSGRTLVPVRLISEQLKATVNWDSATNTVTISLNGKTIVLTIGSSTALVDGSPVQIDVGVTLVTHEGTARTMVPVRFVVENLNATVNYDPATRVVNIIPPPEPKPEPEDDTNIWQNRPITPDGSYGPDNEPEPEPEPEPVPPPGLDENGNLLRRVVLDAGHGGIDPGTSGSGHDEKDINLAVTLKLQTVLQNAGFEVFMARDDDSYVELLERAALTVQEDAPVFVSIHCNSAANIPSASGIETYAAPDDADDVELAGYIQKQVIAATGAKDRGVKLSPLIVLIHNAAPACLVEIGFMSNSAECAKIADPAYQQKLADAIAAGVEAYFAAKAEQ